MVTSQVTISVEEAAAVLGIGRGLAYRLCAAGELPCLRLGSKRLRVPVAALKRLLDEGGGEAKQEVKRDDGGA